MGIFNPGSSTNGYYRVFRPLFGAATAGTWTWNTDAGATVCIPGTTNTGYFFNTTTHAQNDQYTWSNIYLAAGVYKVTCIYTTTTGGNGATFDVYFGTNNIMTINCSGSLAYNNISTATLNLSGADTQNFFIKQTSVGGSCYLQGIYIEKTG